jgi:hypothetical protein
MFSALPARKITFRSTHAQQEFDQIWYSRAN